MLEKMILFWAEHIFFRWLGDLPRCFSTQLWGLKPEDQRILVSPMCRAYQTLGRFPDLAACINMCHHLSSCIITYHQCIILHHSLNFYPWFSFLASFPSSWNFHPTSRCAEHLSGATCDEGRPLEELRKDLPWAQGNHGRRLWVVGCRWLGGDSKWLMVFWFNFWGKMMILVLNVLGLNLWDFEKHILRKRKRTWKGWQSSNNISPMIHAPSFLRKFQDFQLHSRPQISRLERLLWTVGELVDGETTRRSLACGCFLAFPPGAFLQKNVVAKRANENKTRGCVSVGDNEDLGGWFYCLWFLGMIFIHFRQSHWPPAGPRPLGENHIGFVVQCRIGNHKKTPGKLVNWRKKNDFFFLCVYVYDCII